MKGLMDQQQLQLKLLNIATAEDPYRALSFLDEQRQLSNSYTMAWPPVCGYNQLALASGLSYVQVAKRGITILYHLHQCIPCIS